MKILVTGANGQLGNEVRQRLAQQSHHDVVAADLPEFDLSDRDAVLGLITTIRPELVLHGGAMTAVDACETEPDLAYRVNSLGTRHIADAARRVGAHVVYVSTDYVFDGAKAEPYVEWDEPNPQSVYGRSKLGGERELDPGATIVRTSWVCGYHGANMVKTVLRLVDGDGCTPLRFVKDQRGNPTFAEDLASVVIRLGIERRPGVFHVTNQGPVSWYEFVREIVLAAGGDAGRVEPITTAELQPPRPALRPVNSVLDNAALRLSGIELLEDFRVPLVRLVRRLQEQ